jgi:hypothetical protein
VKGVDDLISYYQAITPQLKLHGPTAISEVIRIARMHSLAEEVT